MTADVKSNGDAQSTRPAPTMWAQRPQVVYLTFKVDGCKNPKVTFNNNKVEFSGEDSTKKIVYQNNLEFFEEIDPEQSVWSTKGMGVECTIAKKLNETWPRLTKEKTKIHWLKVDFGKWKDEDDTDDEEVGGGGGGGEPDLSQVGGGGALFFWMMAQMGGGIPGMGGGMPDMADLPEVDSDDEDIPELEETEEA
uniref:Co-chaperone protein daf-41-like n=1 Tax=Ciona intestinalis TaxID=7719 RepID=F6RJZ1_CIOIN